MAQANASRQAIQPRVREEAAQQVAAIAALTSSSTTSQAEFNALRDAIEAAFTLLFGLPES
jgi:hypothetical protein